MTFVYLICFLLLAVGAVLLLKLTPERITGDLMRFVSPKQTLRDKVLTRKGKKSPARSQWNCDESRTRSNRPAKEISLPLPVLRLCFS